MTWDYGTITSATPAHQLANKLGNAMTDSGYYSEVDDYTISTTRYRVWQNSGEGFHVVVLYASAGTGNVSVKLCENYNASTHTASYPARLSGYIQSDYGLGTSAGSGSGGYALDSGLWSSRAAVATNTTGFTYAVSASQKRVTWATFVGTSYYGPAYTGKFEPLYPLIVGAGPAGFSGADPGPFWVGNSASAVEAGAYSRYPAPYQVGTSQTIQGSPSAFTNPDGIPGQYNPVWDGILLSRLQLLHYINYASVPRGLLYGVVTHTNSGSYAFGDELTVSGTPKYKVISGSQSIEML